MAKEEKKKTKRPTAQKRDIRNRRQQMLNKSFKSQVRTVTRSFESSLQKGEKEPLKAALSALYSILDKGVKRGIYKKNKAARLKSNVCKKFLTF